MIADLDGDATAEVLVIANPSDARSNFDCAAADPDLAPRKGLYEYRPGAGRAGARSVWKQHTHHGTGRRRRRAAAGGAAWKTGEAGASARAPRRRDSMKLTAVCP